MLVCTDFCSYNIIREIYYSNKSVFISQNEVVKLLDDITKLFGIEKEETCIYSTPRGFLCGRLEIVTPTATLDFSLSHQIPLITTSYCVQRPTTRSYLLIIEKEAFYERLLQSKLMAQFPCILLCSRGFPDSATLEITKNIAKLEGIIPCCLCDADVYGIEIFLTFLCGGWRKNSDNGIKNLRWVLLRPSEVIKGSPITEKEKTIATNLLKAPVVLRNKEIENEIKCFLKKEEKKEIDEIAKETGYQLETTIISSCLRNKTEFV
ncbi:DNA topoisomerase (ATP-hydrolyzing) [Entamoeba marina]